MINKKCFIEAIHNKQLVTVTFKDGEDRYYFYDLNNPKGKQDLYILPKHVVRVVQEIQNFEPGNYVIWDPNWIVKRDWGRYS